MDHLGGVDSVWRCRIQNGQLDQRVIKPTELLTQGLVALEVRGGEVSYVLHAFGKCVFADQTVAFLNFGLHGQMGAGQGGVVYGLRGDGPRGGL